MCMYIMQLAKEEEKLRLEEQVSLLNDVCTLSQCINGHHSGLLQREPLLRRQRNIKSNSIIKCRWKLRWGRDIPYT